MTRRAILVLADGSVYEGHSFGAETDACGEVVFNTSMTGYQGLITDPSYAGQIVIPTYPLIGNCGINAEEEESPYAQVHGLAVREADDIPSHYLSDKALGLYLAEAGIPGIAELDTRELTRKLRLRGAMMGVITSQKTRQQALDILSAAPRYDQTDFAQKFAGRPVIRTRGNGAPCRYRVAILDCGCNYTVTDTLRALNCAITAAPAAATARDILALAPDGLVISPGPGNPEILDHVVYNIRGLIGYLPMMGLGLGGQLIARAFGGNNFKLKFGHRGANHPVKDLRTGRVYITLQNHGYAPDPASLPPELEISHISLNDGTIEGLRHKTLPVMVSQYYSEASPGPDGRAPIFEEFLQMIHREQKPASGGKEHQR